MRSDARGGLVSLKIGLVIMLKMMGRDGEVVSMAARRCLDFFYLQETGWRARV